MKDNIFAHWLKELCSLVFLQAIQAFIFAIVMALIISVMTPDNVSAIERSDLVASTGIIAVIALASISKLEDLIKKIFGVQSSITDPGMKGGMKSLATTMLAARMAKGVLDNAGKVAGGIGGAVAANRKINLTKARFAKKLNGAGSDDAAGGPSASEQYLNEANEAKNRGDMETYQSKMNMASGAVKAEQGAAKGSGKNDLADAYEKYEDEIAKLKQQRRASVFKTVGGLTETAGAIGGGLTGAMIGASIGEGKEIINAGLVGMGVGDKAGAIPVKAIEQSTNAIKSSIEYREDFVKTVENLNEDARSAINDRKKILTKHYKAKKELEKQMQNFDISDL